MEEKNELIMIPYIAHESILTRQERQIKRMWILTLIIFLALVLTNAGWICYEAQYDTISYEQDGSGVNNLNAGERMIYNNESEIGYSEEAKWDSFGLENPQE